MKHRISHKVLQGRCWTLALWHPARGSDQGAAMYLGPSNVNTIASLIHDESKNVLSF